VPAAYLTSQDKELLEGVTDCQTVLRVRKVSNNPRIRGSSQEGEVHEVEFPGLDILCEVHQSFPHRLPAVVRLLPPQQQLFKPRQC